ncbi:MAG: 3'(2'),5'-bisphosphate nucleotidase CysQ [Nitrospiraceae bacterium]|nr:MAG: 3'(2'),5'-bisphosphate nucleotidase CysQ [Nitrospiraceae bacterium]
MIAGMCGIVREVGELLLEWRDSEIFEGKWEGAQFKAKVDRMAHNALTERLHELSPEIPVISEEDASPFTSIRPGCYWLIDPIDGTASFVNGYSGFVTQVVLMKNDRPEFAAIYAPLLGEMYSAEKGSGSFLNDARLKVDSGKKPAILIDNYPEPRGVAASLYNELNFSRYVECGSISLKICKVADGTADLFFKSVTVRDWDIAAPQLILEEAGGFLKECDGSMVRYDGSFEHDGIVAAASDEACAGAVSWYDNFKKRETIR